jgi:hypothetical protein
MRRSLILWGLFLLFLFVLALGSVSVRIKGAGIALVVFWLLWGIGFRAFFAIDAYLLAKRRPSMPLAGYQKGWVYVLALAMFAVGNNVVASSIQRWIAETFVMPTRGMAPTIMAGDRILVDKLCGSRIAAVLRIRQLRTDSSSRGLVLCIGRQSSPEQGQSHPRTDSTDRFSW